MVLHRRTATSQPGLHGLVPSLRGGEHVRGGRQRAPHHGGLAVPEPRGRGGGLVRWAHPVDPASRAGCVGHLHRYKRPRRALGRAGGIRCRSLALRRFGASVDGAVPGRPVRVLRMVAREWPLGTYREIATPGVTTGLARTRQHPCPAKAFIPKPSGTPIRSVHGHCRMMPGSITTAQLVPIMALCRFCQCPGPLTAHCHAQRCLPEHPTRLCVAVIGYPCPPPFPGFGRMDLKYKAN